MSRSDYTTHNCNFNTAGYCPGCGARVALPEPSTTAPPVYQLTPFILPPPPAGHWVTPEEIVIGPHWVTPEEIEAAKTDVYAGEPAKVNMGSPVGPGFVVYERAPGYYGYDVKMARGSIGPGWRHLVQALFDHVEHDKKWNPSSGFAHMVVTQVKEKFGALRIYFHINAEPFEPHNRPVGERVSLREGAFDQVEGFVDALTSVSTRTCEACGGLALSEKERRPRSWILSLCRTCDAKDANELRALLSPTEQSE